MGKIAKCYRNEFSQTVAHIYARFLLPSVKVSAVESHIRTWRKCLTLPLPIMCTPRVLWVKLTPDSPNHLSAPLGQCAIAQPM